MKARTMIPVAILAACGAACAATVTTDDANRVYVVTADEPYSSPFRLTYDLAHSANDSGYDIAKRGEGHADAGSGFSSFAGELRIEEGTFVAIHPKSFGAVSGRTVVSNGATLKISASENSLSYTNEEICLAGTLLNNWDPQPYLFPGPVTLVGDTVVTGNTMGVCGILALDGHTLAMDMNKSAYLLLSDAEIFSGGTISQTKGHFRTAGTIAISARDAVNLPHLEVANGGAIASYMYGHGGNVAALTKTGGNTFVFDSSLAVTGETQVAAGTLKIGGATAGTIGIVEAATNFADKASWLAFVGAASQDDVPNMNNDKFKEIATNLLAIGVAEGFTRTVDRPAAAYSTWSDAEKFKLVAYRGTIWNGDTTNKLVTFATSIADTALLWINDSTTVRNIWSKQFASTETYFTTLGEAVLRPGPNEFMLLLGHHKTGSKGPRPAAYPARGLKWTDGLGFMRYEGRYTPGDYTESGTTYHNVTNSADFAQLIDPGDGSLFMVDRNPPAAQIAANPAKFRPRFDSLKFGRDTSARCTFDLGGLSAFPQNGLAGCPCVTNGSMILSGVWSVTKDDLDVHPLEVADGAAVAFDGATLEVAVAGLAEEGVVVLRAAPGATVSDEPVVSVADGARSRWAVRREESAQGVELILYRRIRGLVVDIK